MFKKFILLTSLALMFGLAEAQAQPSYIIVHALNPEGVEIASIESGNLYYVEIFDDADLIGYGAYDAGTHNVPIPIAPGAHIIKAKFNGMTKEQSVTLNQGETKVVIFTFNRTQFDLINAIESVSTIMTDSRYGSTDASSAWPEAITPTGQYQWDILNTIANPGLFSSEVSVSISGDTINITGFGTRPPGASWVKIWAPATLLGLDLYAYKQIDFGSTDNFEKWIIQTIYPDLQTNAIVNISDELIDPIYYWNFNLTPWSFRLNPEQVGKTHVLLINNKKKYYIEVTAIQRVYSNFIYEDVNWWSSGTYIHSYDISEKMGLSDCKDVFCSLRPAWHGHPLWGRRTPSGKSAASRFF